MSDRGSFITEYIYCDDCFRAAKSVLIGNGKHLHSTTIPHWAFDGKENPIIAGRIGGLFAGEELQTMECELIPKLERLICHKIRIAVLAEEGERIFTAIPKYTKTVLD